MKESAFENQVLSGLQKCSINLEQIASCGGTIGAAVSGGADSVSLLYALAVLCRETGVPLKVITINHYMRADAETCADAAFVQTQCQKLHDQGFNVEFTLHELGRGDVSALAQEKGIGEEAAARELRYQAFDTFIQKNSLTCLCLAHNKNDQTETLLMRFLQGAGGSAAAGIPAVRGKYVRPLLWTERSAIESYLREKNLSWQTDSTNNDTRYLRNKIRHELIPFLNQHFTGWDNAVLNGAQKAADDSEFLQQQAAELFKDLAKIEENQVIFAGRSFYQLGKAFKTRLILLAANSLGLDMRIPYVFLRDVCDCADNYIEEKSEKKGGGAAVKSFANLQIVLKNDGVYIKKTPQVQNEIVFSVIIEESGMYEFPWGQVNVPSGFRFPVLLRSWHSDDMILAADGGMRKVSDIISSWHVAETLRHYIPVVQVLDEPEQRILGILGSCQGYKDWIVKNEKM